MSQPTVAVSDLVKVFYDEARGEVRAVDGVSFECRPGEIFGLLGANGAGKTTTLRMLATILQPTSGQRDYHGSRRARRARGGAPQPGVLLRLDRALPTPVRPRDAGVLRPHQRLSPTTGWQRARGCA